MTAQREWFEKDYYQVLGVPENASEKEITNAYRKLAKRYHPDANPGAEDKFKEVSAAYDVIGNAELRAEYDQVRRMGHAGFSQGGFGGGFGGANVGGENLSDLLGGMFGAGAGGFGGANFGGGFGQRRGPQRGADLETDLYLPFEDAVGGTTTHVSVVSDTPCDECDGSGAAPGTLPTVCPTCAGRGTADVNQGMFSFAGPCATCGGSGMRIDDPCQVCHGSGLVRKSRQIKVRIPAGVKDGGVIRLREKGGAGSMGGPAGDLLVRVRVGQHHLFGRKGKDLTIRVPVTVSEAALGATITVPTMSAPVSLRIPAGTKPGQVFRVKPEAAGAPGALLVTVDVVIPDEMSPEQRAAYEQLRSVEGSSLRENWFAGSSWANSDGADVADGATSSGDER